MDDNKEFNPSESDEFQKKLEEALQPEGEKEEEWKPELEEDNAWIDIGNESSKDEVEEEIPVLEFSEELFALESNAPDEKSETKESKKTEDVGAEQKEVILTEAETKASEEAENVFVVSDAEELNGSSEAGDTEEADEASEENDAEGSEDELPELDLSDSVFELDADDFEEEDPADELMEGIDAALAEQLEHEFGKEVFEEKKPNAFVRFINAIPKWAKILISVMFVLIIAVCLLFGTHAGRGLVTRVVVEILLSNAQPEPTDIPPEITITLPPDITEEPVALPTQEPGATPLPTVALPTGEVVQDSTVINVLLIGEENIWGSHRGRSDSILLASVDKDGGPIKLVSFMRDIYCSIPGYPDNRLNAAYFYGGPKLLMETIEQNFKVKIDSYVVVNFAGFEAVIDQLGGIEVSLTAEESKYLNTTNYISNKANRTTVPGKQLMNGNQVLGYCRVRHVKTANGLKDDFGRTWRQRFVLQSIFNKYKEKNFAELLSVMNTCFGYVTAPESLKKVAAECLQAVIEKKMFSLDQMQFPLSNLLEDAKIGDSEVIIPMPENVTVLHKFLYGEER